MDASEFPHGYDSWTHTEVVPKPPPVKCHWRVRVMNKTFEPELSFRTGPFKSSEVTVQLTADQQVELTISGQDAYGNEVTITGDISWVSSDESIVTIANPTQESATAVAVGPVGTASVTVSNDVNQDGTGDFQGSLAIDVVAGEVTEIVIEPGTPTDKT